MMKYALISVRANSSRMPMKCFLELGSQTILEHNIERLKHFGFHPIVCTSENESDDLIVEISTKAGAKTFRGSEEDKLNRWLMATQHFGISKFITADCDDPFLCPQLMNRALDHLGEGNDFTLLPKNQPRFGAYEGCVGYAVDSAFLEEVCEKKSTNNTEHAWQFFVKERQATFVHCETEDLFCDAPEIRLTMDYPEDYLLLRKVYDKLGGLAERTDIVSYLSANEGLVKLNWFRNSEYLERHSSDDRNSNF